MAANDSYNVNEDQTLSVPYGATDVLGNDAYADGNNLAAALVRAPSHGKAMLNGLDSFTYRANDGTVNINTATVNITVNPVNDPLTFARGAN